MTRRGWWFDDEVHHAPHSIINNDTYPACTAPLSEAPDTPPAHR